MMKSIELNSIKSSKAIVFFCWLAYSCSYIGRTNYSAAVAAIVSEGLFTKSQAGLVGTVFFFCYGAGQLFSGRLGDRFSPFKMVFGGLLISSAANLAMYFCESHLLMAFIWGANGLAMSMLWSPILRIFSNVIHKDLRQKACLNIYSSFPVGTVASYAASTLIIKYFEWRFVFVFASAMLALALITGIFIYGSVHKQFIVREITPPSFSQGSGSKSTLFAIVLSSGLPLILLPTMLHGAIKDGLTSWVPTMLTEAYPISPSFSVFLTIALPLASLFGAYGISPLYKKAFKYDEMKTSAAAVLFSVLPLISLMFIGRIPLAASVIMLALTTTSMHALNYMLVTMVPVRFASFNKTSTVAGLVNAAVYAGSTVSSYGFGAFSGHFGWQRTIMLWLAIVLVILITCVLSRKRWIRFTRQNVS